MGIINLDNDDFSIHFLCVHITYKYTALHLLQIQKVSYITHLSNFLYSPSTIILGSSGSVTSDINDNDNTNGADYGENSTPQLTTPSPHFRRYSSASSGGSGIATSRGMGGTKRMSLGSTPGKSVWLHIVYVRCSVVMSCSSWIVLCLCNRSLY